MRKWFAALKEEDKGNKKEKEEKRQDGLKIGRWRWREEVTQIYNKRKMKNTKEEIMTANKDNRNANKTVEILNS